MSKFEKKILIFYYIIIMFMFFRFIEAALAMASLYGWIGNWTQIYQYLVVQLKK